MNVSSQVKPNSIQTAANMVCNMSMNPQRILTAKPSVKSMQKGCPRTSRRCDNIQWVWRAKRHQTGSSGVLPPPGAIWTRPADLLVVRVGFKLTAGHRAVDVLKTSNSGGGLGNQPPVFATHRGGILHSCPDDSGRVRISFEGLANPIIREKAVDLWTHAYDGSIGCQHGPVRECVKVKKFKKYG
uniref:Uncharacterized protein n=1 Tax=Magallana gigas TaxID=29159 RepID=A0A8W8MGA8_MAGGI